MAGSYNHVRPLPEPMAGSWSYIENMGDAHECVEELLWLALHFAALARLGSLASADAAIMAALDDEFYPMARGEREPDEFFRAVRQVMSGQDQTEEA